MAVAAARDDRFAVAFPDAAQIRKQTLGLRTLDQRILGCGRHDRERNKRRHPRQLRHREVSSSEGRS
jgi:hypothetical protein